MGRTRRPLELSAGRPYGQRWTRYCAGLRAGWFRAGRNCFYCQHPFAAPHLIEVAHLISPLIRADLGWSRDNLVPSHGPGKKTGNKRCPLPECDLNCNWLAHNSPDAPKDKDGADLPFTPEFLARVQRERAQFTGKPVIPGKSRALVVPFRRIDTEKGREW
jgi:hypothetical protein